MKKPEADNDYQNILADCSRLIDLSSRSRWDLIKHNFELGKNVSVLLEDTRYGEKTIAKLAKDISARLGKQIFPSQLYECGVVFRHFGSFSKIEKIEKQSANQISWHFLLQSANREKEEAERRKKAESVDPEYIAHLRAIKHGMRKLKGWLRRNELPDETRKDVLIKLSDLNEYMRTLIKEFADIPPVTQLRIFSTVNGHDFALNDHKNRE